MPAMPAPTIATSDPNRSGGTAPMPAGSVIQSSYGNGKSGPKAVSSKASEAIASVLRAAARVHGRRCDVTHSSGGRHQGRH
jgi:hypothetical protein